MDRAIRAWGMVAVQAVLFLAVAVTAVMPWGPRVSATLVGSIAVVVVGAVGVLWCARDLGRSLTASPVPNGGGLVARGAYRWARHPMYSALVVICLGVAIGAGAVWTYVSVVALAVFFYAKSEVEERYLLRAYEGYAEYAARTGRFVPGVGRRANGGDDSAHGPKGDVTGR